MKNDKMLTPKGVWETLLDFTLLHKVTQKIAANKILQQQQVAGWMTVAEETSHL